MIAHTLVCVALTGITALSCLASTSPVPGVSPHNPTAQILRIPAMAEGTDPVYNYVTELLTLALQKNEAQYGPVQLLPNEQASVQGRQLRNLSSGLLDITWSITSLERERNYRPVRIPLLDGLFGKRVLLIKTGDVRFEQLIDEQQLKSMYALQGYDWPDSRILRHNNYKVIEAPYQAAFRLLSDGYADYFPRALLEVSYELEQWQAEGIALEQHLILSYRSAMFFFVHKSNQALAQRLQNGLERLQNEGTFSALLHRQTFYQQGMKLVGERHEIVLENPLLSGETQQAIKVQLPFISHH